MRASSFFLISLLWLQLLGSARAQQAARGEAERRPSNDPFQGHLKQATELYNQQRYQASLAELQAAYALYPLPRLQFNLAQVHRKLGHTKEALEAYALFLQTEPHIPPEQRAEVERRIAELRPARESQAPASPAGPPVGAPAPAAPPAATTPVQAAAVPLLPVQPTLVAQQQHARPAPLYRRWWFWGAIGVVAAGTVAGVVAGTYHGPPAIPMDIPFHTEKWTPQ